MVAQLPQVTAATTVYQVGCSHSHDDLDHPGAHNASNDGWHLPLHCGVQRACSLVSHAAAAQAVEPLVIGLEVASFLRDALRFASPLACSRTPHQDRQSSRHIGKTCSVAFWGFLSLSWHTWQDTLLWLPSSRPHC